MAEVRIVITNEDLGEAHKKPAFPGSEFCWATGNFSNQMWEDIKLLYELR